MIDTSLGVIYSIRSMIMRTITDVLNHVSLHEYRVFNLFFLSLDMRVSIEERMERESEGCSTKNL
jgi:hypothetical protein